MIFSDLNVEMVALYLINIFPGFSCVAKSPSANSQIYIRIDEDLIYESNILH